MTIGSVFPLDFAPKPPHIVAMLVKLYYVVTAIGLGCLGLAWESTAKTGNIYIKIALLILSAWGIFLVFG